MQPIFSFEALTNHLQQTKKKFRLAVVCGSDANTVKAIMQAVKLGFAEAIFVGDVEKVKAQLEKNEVAKSSIFFLETATHEEAATTAVQLVRQGKVEVLVKGLLHTATLLRAVLNKENGILPQGKVLTHIMAAEIPTYHKLLFLSDAAVIPYPTHEQRAAQIGYMAEVLHKMGIVEPRIALLHCAETVSDKFPHTLGYSELCSRAKKGEWGKCIVDGPLDLRTSCDVEAMRIKGIVSPIEGKADGLIVPDIEVGNALYKSIPLFAHARLAGTLCGTTAPVVLPSRGDDAEAKYNSLALAILSSRKD